VVSNRRKVEGTLERGDARCEVLHDPEMTAAPRDFLAELDQAAGPASDCDLIRVGERLDVQIEIARSIEASLDRRANGRFDSERFHAISLH
jgi:hypothetical protein